MNEKTICECEISCPYCGKERGYTVSTDEIEFCDDGTGHYFADVYCPDCGKGHRKYWRFKYEITERWESK